MKKWILGLLTALLLISCCAGALAAEAMDITDDCTFKVSYTSRKYTSMTDGKYTTYWESKKANNPWVQVTAPAGMPIHGLYLCFSKMPETWEVQVDNGNGWETYYVGNDDFYHVYVPMQEGFTQVRVYCTLEKKFVMGFNEFFVLSAGDVPDWVQRWEPTHEKADILFLSAHPDDELIFFGGGIPTYAAEQQRKVVVAYLSYSNTTRRSELLNGLWHMGVRNYPVIGEFRDAYAKNLKTSYKNAGGEKKVMEYVVGLYRKYQPEVVVTHDVNGEYGHKQHMMVAEVAQKAYDVAATEEEYLESFLEYGTWQVKKLYLHLWPENQIMFDWTVPLQSMNGKTGIQLAEEAYAMHVTQAGSGMSVTETGAEYDNRIFGLARTTVGEDVRKDDFLENIYDPASYVPITPTPSPVPTATPAPAYAALLPQLNEKGFLDEGEFIYSSEEEGLYIFIDQTCKVIIQRRYDSTQPLTWFEADIWSDVEAGEMLKTIQYDPEKMGKVRVDASENAIKNKTVFAMNTDYYTYRVSVTNSRRTGVVIRDGKILYDDPYDTMVDYFPNLDTLAFYPDGSMDVHASCELSAQDYIDRGAYAVYSFGPYLIRDGKLSEKAYTSADTKNPRCAIGMVEPGHYVAIMCEGRLSRSGGVSVGQLAKLMRAKGCEVAFNLDGGQTAVMVFMGKQLNQIGKYDGKTSARPTSEILGIGFSEQVGIYEVQ